MIDSVPLIQNANDAQQINASIIAMKKASRELDEKIVKLNSLNSELDKKIALLDSGLNKEIEDRKEAINSLDVPSVGGSGKYISAISETDGKINATASDLATSVTSGNSQPVTSEAVANYVGNMELITDANNAIPPNNKEKTYYIYYTDAHIPSNTYNFVIVAYNGRASSSETVRRLVQMAYATGDDNYGLIYTRLAFSSDGGANWTWRNWEKLIKESDLTSSAISGSSAPITSGGVYSALNALNVLPNNTKSYIRSGDGTQYRLKIAYSGSVVYAGLTFLICSRYSIEFIHIEIDSSGKFFNLRSNVITERNSGDVTIAGTANPSEIFIKDTTSWNAYNILVFSTNANVFDGLTITVVQ